MSHKADQNGGGASESVKEATTTDAAQQPQEKCASKGCARLASMACPKCLELKLPVTLFCSQACFKASWAEHKKAHKPPPVDYDAQTDRDGELPEEFRGYDFTGPLRPWRKTPMRIVPDHIPRPDYAGHPAGMPASEIADRGNTSIRVYSSKQIAGIREACRIGREVLDIAGRAISAGVTTNEIDRIVHEATIERGAYPSPLNYYRFPKSVCTSVNEVICHGIPDMRELVDGDIVNIDVTAYFNGYHGDLNETFLVGDVDEEGQRLVRCAFDCLSAAMDMVKPGTMYRDIGTVISRVASAAGCSVVRTYCGHGIGELFHTTPNVPHYAKNKAKGVMKPGHVFTIEPMINTGTWQSTLWPDSWSAVTKDGTRSAQFEHTILVTEEGYEILTARDDEPVMQWKPELLQR